MWTHFKKARSFYVCALVFGLIFSTKISAQTNATNQEPIKVVASFSILADIVHQVGGPWVEVHALVGPNSDAHVFNPTPHDARQLARAEIVVINGLGFEGWMERLINASGFEGSVVVASNGVETLETVDEHEEHAKHEGAHEHDSLDPHAWQDLRNVKIYVANISEALIQLRPQAREEISRQTRKYLAQIDALETGLNEQFEKIPADHRRVIVSHDAFGYLARAYGIEFLPVQGWSTGREASAGDVANLIRQVRAGQVRAYFVESMSDPRVLQRIADETGAKIGGKLYSDALSAPDAEAGTYLKMYEVNAQRLLDALTQ